MSSQLDGRVASLSAKGIPPLFSLLCCYSEDRRFLCSSLTLFHVSSMHACKYEFEGSVCWLFDDSLKEHVLP